MKKNIMAKKFALILCLFITVFSLSFNVNATEIPEDRLLPRVVDNARLLTESEKAKLLVMVDEISERQQCDVAIVTVKSLDGKTSTEYADDFYDYNGYGMGSNDDGILLLISMQNRDWAISTYGYGIRAFTDAGQRYIMDQVTPLLSDAKYSEAFTSFADYCDDFITEAKAGKPYDTNNMPKGKVSPLWILGDLGIGAVIAFIIMFVMKKSLTTVEMQRTAKNYVVDGSLELTNDTDMFLYRNVNRTAKPKNNSSGGGSSTHSSSSGRSHGGSSGSF
ncbi:MAG: TPM domain-containing protein [Clostridiales bacterium]|nr:TPM domain-containing protein [Clostridiales bacterium]